MVALVVFIVLLCTARSGGTKKEIDDIAAPVAEAVEGVPLYKQSNADIVKTFGFDTANTAGAVYYASNNVMEASEFLLVKVNDPADAPAIKEAIETRVTNQQNLYKSYAPEQYSLLTNSIIEISGNTVFYCTAINADALYEVFQKEL